MSTHNLGLWGLSAASGATVLGEARMLASVSEMLWKVTPKVPASKVLWNPCTFADLAEVLQKIRCGPSARCANGDTYHQAGTLIQTVRP